MSGPDYSQKSSAQIIEEQAASLNAKEDRHNKSASYDTHNTTLSEESGVNESGLSEFPGAEVHVGRTGYTGGGDNMVRPLNVSPLSLRRADTGIHFAQGIPVEHGGDPRTDGSTAADFDDVPAGEDRNSWQAKTQPGSSESPSSHVQLASAPTSQSEKCFMMGDRLTFLLSFRSQRLWPGKRSPPHDRRLRRRLAAEPHRLLSH